MIIGLVRESFPGERRVALVPAAAGALVKAGHTVNVETGAGEDAGFVDHAYVEAGATVMEGREPVFRASEVVCQVRTLGANPEAGEADLAWIGRGHTLIGLCEPLTDAGPIRRLAESGAQSFAMELMPRITRAQSMDVLSSQATVAGYEAVILAAGMLPRIFPMLMTAAGTLAPARVFVIGAGVAGLQAISTARRLGGVVTGYDIRPVVREQVESLGARFLEIEVPGEGAEDKGGYAKAMADEVYRSQQALMTRTVAESDVVITTAAVPGRKAPVLVTADMVRGMAAGSVIVDLAAERGGNCALTRADEIVHEHGVTIIGPTNTPSMAPFHASQMYSRNVHAFLGHLAGAGAAAGNAGGAAGGGGALHVDPDDEITAHTLLTRGGRVVHRRVCEILGLEAPEPAAAPAPGGPGDGGPDP